MFSSLVWPTQKIMFMILPVFKCFEEQQAGVHNMKKALSSVKEVCERHGVTKDFSELFCWAVKQVWTLSIFHFNWEFRHPVGLTIGIEINTSFKAFTKYPMQMQLLHPHTEA